MNHSIQLKLLVGAVAVLTLLAAFGVPVLGYLPILGFFAICTLGMMFMMRGSDHDADASGDGDRADQPPSAHRH